MPSLVISIDGTIIKEVALTKERTTVGRRPYNDIVIDNLAVSGEHALLHRTDASICVEDLRSTNGTYVNRQRITRQDLLPGDQLDIGKYQMRLVLSDADNAESPAPMPAPAPVPAPLSASLLLEDGGRQVPLVKTVTTLGKPGVAVAAITHKPTGFTLARIEGEDGSLLLNGQGVGTAPQPLQHGDRMELAGSRLQFLLQA